jgi:DNA-binding response OmpR family regulator
MRLLLVEDEERLARAVRRVLESEHYQVDHVDNGADAVAMGQGSEYDVIVLDVMLPIMTGVQVCRVLRESGIQTPILMLTALGEVEDRVAGLDVGADDYLVKPFAFDELLARLRALLRRKPEMSQETALHVGDLELELTKHRARRGDIDVELTATEFRLLELLMRHVGQVVSRVRILERV